MLHYCNFDLTVGALKVVYSRKWLFLRARNICPFGIFYYRYFVTLSYNQEEHEGIIKETKSLFLQARTNSRYLYSNLQNIVFLFCAHVGVNETGNVFYMSLTLLCWDITIATTVSSKMQIEKNKKFWVNFSTFVCFLSGMVIFGLVSIFSFVTKVS